MNKKLLFFEKKLTDINMLALDGILHWCTGEIVLTVHLLWIELQNDLLFRFLV